MSLSRRSLLAATGTLFLPQLAQAVPARAPAPSIGVALPLTGNAALLGDEIWRGIQLAAAAVPSLALHQADMPAPARAADTINALVTSGHAGLLLGCGTSALCSPASVAAELAQIPLIELTAPADGLLRRGFASLLRTSPSAAMAAALAAQTLAGRYPKARLGLLYNTGADGTATATALREAGVTPVLAAGYPEDVADLRDPVGRMMRAEVDVLLHAAGLDDALGVFLAASELGWRPGGIIGFGPGYTYRETQDALGGALEGVLVIAAPGWATAPAALAATYTAQFGVPPRAPDSLTAYAGAKLVFETLNNVNQAPTKLLAALRAVQQPLGTLANGFGAAFNASGQNTGAFVTLQEWRASGLVPV